MNEKCLMNSTRNNIRTQQYGAGWEGADLEPPVQVACVLKGTQGFKSLPRRNNISFRLSFCKAG
ncbi:MAG: hypothetical protein C5S38_04100 [Candidatus Methanophagaceae archaeon]|jgi:hypothetical protein|nr:MAG: hypothetical protein C5S38_04100 [Methanophagales archaeon]